MYRKTEWKARKGSNLSRFEKFQETSKSVILENTPTAVTEAGTPFSVENMNKIEQGIYDVHEAVADEVNTRQQADQYLQSQIASLPEEFAKVHERIDSVENLGHYAGTYDTFSLLPKNKSGFPNGITVNDFVTIRTDETHDGAVTRYVVLAINSSGGAITWSYDITYSTDVSGKQDKLNRNIIGNDNATGAVTDTGGDLSIPIPVTTVDPAASDTQTTAATRSLRAQIKIFADNIAHLFDNKIDTSEKGAAGGVATLGTDGFVPASQLPQSIEIPGTEIPGTGLLAVSHDNTLQGDGTPASPLAIPLPLRNLIIAGYGDARTWNPTEVPGDRVGGLQYSQAGAGDNGAITLKLQDVANGRQLNLVVDGNIYGGAQQNGSSLQALYLLSSAVITLSTTGQEALLSKLYGGTWCEFAGQNYSTPAIYDNGNETFRIGAFDSPIGSGTKTIFERDIANGGYTVNISFTTCGGNLFQFYSTTRGMLYLTGAGSVPTIITQPGESLWVNYQGGIGENVYVSWSKLITPARSLIEYKYFRVG